MTNKLLPSLAALTLLAPTMSVKAEPQREIRTTPSSSYRLADQATPADFVHDYLRTHSTDLRNLERNTTSSLTNLFDNNFNNQEFVDLSRRGSTLVIGTTDEPRYGRIENGQIVSPGYQLQTLQLRNPQEFDNLMARINKAWKESQPSIQPSTKPQYQPQTQQETEKPEENILSSISDSFGKLSDFEAGLIGLGVGVLVGREIFDDRDSYRRHNGRSTTRYYSGGSPKQRRKASNSVFRDRRRTGYHAPRRCR